MFRYAGIKSRIPLFVGALVLATGCTFEPPGSVLNNEAGPQADAGSVGNPDAEVAEVSTETLTFTFTTSPTPNPVYQPANVLAVWVEDAAATHVATIYRESGTQWVNRLVAWRAASGPNNLDAVTGATRLNHALPVTATWAIPANLPIGTYTIRAENADTNALTPDVNNQGVFTFEKNGTASSLPGIDNNGYTGITIDYAVAAP